MVNVLSAMQWVILYGGVFNVFIFLLAFINVYVY